MDYKLFDEFITLQALLKELSIIHSGGAAKTFLSENTVLFNNEKEERRGKKVRIGDIITIVNTNTTISIVEPSQEEKQEHLEAKLEKARVEKLVKDLNKKNKTSGTSVQKQSKKPVRFPGT